MPNLIVFVMKRIVIQLSELSRENWQRIYCFIERCLGSKEYREDDFNTMKNNNIDIGIDDDPKKCDVCSIKDEGVKELQYGALPEKGDYVFNIIYVKTDEREEFSDFTRFFLLKKKYSERITLGIDLSVFLDNESFQKYRFQLAIFLFFIKDKLPQLGWHSLYLIKSINDTPKVSAIPYMLEGSEPNYKLASPFLLPLIPINRNNFGVFEKTIYQDNEVGLYIEHSLINIQKRLEKEKRGIPDLNECHTLFEKWLVSSFYLSLDDNNVERFDEWKSVLLEYCHNIFELVQNILFHTKEKRGLFYMVFNKKEKVTKLMQTCIPDFDDSEENLRFLEFGIYDYGNEGIVRTFCDKEGLSFNNYKLRDFFELNRLFSLYKKRSSEHLGIRSFVNSIKEHKGYFRVESNNSNDFKDLIENSKGNVLKESLNIVNFYGTFYDVVIPVNNTEKTWIATSRSCLRDKLKESKMCLPSFPRIQPKALKYFALSLFNSKVEQEKEVDKVANSIIREILNKTEDKGMAVDMNRIDMHPNFLYKLIDKLFEFNNKQKVINSGFILIFTNLNSEAIDAVSEYFDMDISLLPNKGQHFPVVLIGKQWQIQILYGERREELLYVNRRIHSMFFSKDHFGPTVFSDNTLTAFEKNQAEKVIMPYDLMINDANGETLFASLVNEALDTPIENDHHKLGCKINFPTKIGSKLYVDNYFEADILFHNNFFTDRFAYFIAKEIISKILNKNVAFIGKKLVLIGYNPYSAPLTARVKEYVNDCISGLVTDIVIVKEKDKEKGFEFKLSKEQADYFLDDIDNYSFVSIVPIASTLSTTDKIIALFNKELEDRYKNREKSSWLFPDTIKTPKIRFVYNHVTILVRDKNGKMPTNKEKARKWISIRNHTINTAYQSLGKKKGGIKVNFLIQKVGKWYELINPDTFPKNWWEEKYINQTKNASINTKEMHGIPFAALPEVKEMEAEIAIHENEGIVFTESDISRKYFLLSEKKLREMSGYIYFGHIMHGGSHHRYYFDIEQLFDSVYRKTIITNPSRADYILERSFQLLSNWLSYVKGRIEQNDHNVLNVIITPDDDYESCYVSTINEKVFNNNAFIVYLNVNGPLQDSKIKLSYLKAWHKHQKPNYYFVDQALHTGSTYQKTRSCMASIFDDDGFSFDGVLTIINRLTKDKYEEILHGLNFQIIFSYLHFFVLPSKEPEKDCSLCGLKELYENLKEYTAIEDCLVEIEYNRKKFEIKEFSHYLDEKSDKKKNKIEKNIVLQNVSENNRYWLRMIWRHRLFFELTVLQTIDNFSQVFDNLYRTCITLDEKVSFLKAITFPPLSQYVIIRAYAHKLQLKELHTLFSKSQPDFDDFCLLLVLLKHLSFLGSNAIVRREVILNSWKLYLYVIEHNKVDFQKKKFNRDSYNENDFIREFIFFIKLATYKDEAKSLWLGELLRKGKKEMNPKSFGPEYKVHATKLYNSLWLHFEKTGFNNKVLPYLFYDNTAITRKTLENLALALDKDDSLKELLKEHKRGGDGWKLKTFKQVSKDVDVIVSKYKEIIIHEYYYSWFKHFLDDNCNTPDGIPLLKKFVFVLYESLLLKDLVNPNTQNDKPFDQNARDLLEVATRVMNADSAFIIVKDETGRQFNLANYNIEINAENEKDYYYKKLLFGRESQKKGQPFVIMKDLSSELERFLGIGQFNRATYLMLNRAMSPDVEIDYELERPVIGVVVFLYEDKDLKRAQEEKEYQTIQEKKTTDNKISKIHNGFMINAQESGRLLLLLKPQIDEYVEHVAKERQFEVWKEKQEKNTDFIRVNLANNHQLNFGTWSFGEVIQDKESKECKENRLMRANSWFMLSDAITKHYYSKLLQYGRITLPVGSLDDKGFLLSELFDRKFINVLNSLYEKKWEGADFAPTVFSLPLDTDILRLNLKIYGQIPVFQSFIIQCINNAFNAQPGFYYDLWNVSLKAYIEENQTGIIEIINYFKIDDDKRTYWLNEKKNFINKYDKETLEKLSIDGIRKYRFTLISLIKYIEAINAYYKNSGLHYECLFIYNTDNQPYSFSTKIMFNSNYK